MNKSPLILEIIIAWLIILSVWTVASVIRITQTANLIEGITENIDNMVRIDELQTEIMGKTIEILREK
ncbi:MAG TPA: hypothetical protein ENI23_17880 [bacterium]|nr:hypothetical protein [bacterium]